MTVPSLTQVFGTNCTQDATHITISKADLAATGLTASATNDADSLVVALLMQWATTLNTTAQSTNSDINVTIDQSAFGSIVYRNQTNYRQFTFTVNLQKVDTGATLNPNDY